ncbi:hypothetical protein NDU88_004545 [Pleurodeles waltl]|uniref:Uncharacterized protein n=1 Tax=Pleurodeles waltl TaxID=8319 RepID=A0AAV7W5J6_PLEWA|nr:hypothetical protein NDU88_004545 [Pleurodeles waltl]
MLTCSTPAAAKDNTSVPLPHLRPVPEESSNPDQAPVAQALLASLFDSLKTDLQNLRKDLSQDIKEPQQERSSVGERVSTLEDNEVQPGEEMEMLSQEVIWLQEQQEDLRAQAEDLKNCSRHNNIHL